MAFNRLLLGAALVGFLATPAHAVVKQYRLELIDLANFIDDDGNDGVQTPGTAAEPINGDFQFTTDLSRIGETIAPDFASLVLDFGTRVASFDSGNVNVSINPSIPGLSPPADSSQSVILVEGGEPFSEPGGDPVFGDFFQLLVLVDNSSFSLGGQFFSYTDSQGTFSTRDDDVTFLPDSGIIQPSSQDVPPDTGVIPLPAALPMLLAGLGVFGLIAHRRRQA